MHHQLPWSAVKAGEVGLLHAGILCRLHSVATQLVIIIIIIIVIVIVCCIRVWSWHFHFVLSNHILTTPLNVNSVVCIIAVVVVVVAVNNNNNNNSPISFAQGCNFRVTGGRSYHYQLYAMQNRNVFSHDLKDPSESLSLTVLGKVFQVCK